MTKEEELITIAKKKFVKGCRFKSAVISSNPSILEFIDIGEFQDKKKNYTNILWHTGCGFLYTDQKGWAEVISYPKDYTPPISHELINSYIL